MFKKFAFGMVCISLVLTSCAPNPPAPAQEMMVEPTQAMLDKPAETMMDKPTEVMMDKPTEVMMAQEAALTPEPANGGSMASDPMLASPVWLSTVLTNVRSGEVFTIQDYLGKVVLVETLAMWCSNCKKQQIQVQALHTALGEMGADLVSIGLDIDSNEVAADLKEYTEVNGFDWVYTIAPVEVTREIGQLYGDQFLNPPSTPILIIDRQGQVHPLPFGIKSAEDLKQFILPFLNQ